MWDISLTALAQTWDSEGRSFHACALSEARLYEEKVTQDLGARVFNDIFPLLVNALARGDSEARIGKAGKGHFDDDYLDEVREAALILLYRLLFLFYAEDRKLLPVQDERYVPYSVRRVREEVRDKVDKNVKLSSTVGYLWIDLQNVFTLIDAGDDAIGVPAYNGGLFAARLPLLHRVRMPDKVIAPIIDTLSRHTEGLFRSWINYRDLSVSHLGGIYERLLEYKLVHEIEIDGDGKPTIDRIVARPASFARKVSGSYYTHDDLVRLILRESVGLLVDERKRAFEAQIGQWHRRGSLTTSEWQCLDGMPEKGQQDSIDPATQILELKICDPAMGSGHFLVKLVDDLADRVLEAIAGAGQLVNAQRWAAHLAEAGRPWQSPVLQHIAAIRRGIKANAQKHGWSVTDAQLDDRHIVRRMILKKVVFGVDKNPMAVELAKTALWLHTFTVGAPLSFLDHHLKTGDSLHGERISTVQRGLQALGALFLSGAFDHLAQSASAIAQVADLTDADIAEVWRSRELATEAETLVAPIHAALDFWRALRWLIPGWPVEESARLARLFSPARGKTGITMLEGLVKLLDPEHDLATVLHTGQIEGKGQAVNAANMLMAEARALARRETFFHWWTSFPTVFGVDGGGGFDAVIGNPPWDRIKLQEVEWFAERDHAIAAQPRAADRARMIGQLKKKKSPLWGDYLEAVARAEANARVLGNSEQGSGDYPLLGGDDVNLYSLFVERAQSLISKNGIVALLTPSGIAADKGAAKFFRSIATTQRLGALFDFENKKVFFPDVHASFKFCALVFGGGKRTFETTRCAFYLHNLDELDTGEHVLELSAEDFARVNPNTGTAPVFRNRRDAEITMRLYRDHPVLVRRGGMCASNGQQPDAKAWPVEYATMFHMTTDSRLFQKVRELRRQGFTRAELNRWVDKQGNEALPLYVGRMIHQYDHRSASVDVNEENLMVATLSDRTDDMLKKDPAYYPTPQYWIEANSVPQDKRHDWALGFRDIARATDARTMIAAIVPGTAAGNTLPLLLPESGHGEGYARTASLLLANFNTLAFDYIARQKVQTTHLNKYILEQLPVIIPARFDASLPAAFVAAMREARLIDASTRHPTPYSIADFILSQVLALSYTAHDLAPFARDLGYVDKAGRLLPPFTWDEEDRRARMSALDALFFHLYGLNAEDAAYIMDTFPIVREQEKRAFGRYRTKEDILALLPLLK